MAPVVGDELEAIISALCQKYPEHSALDIEAVVAQAYAELAADAKVTAHLIPLTLNRSRRLLAKRLRDDPGSGVATPGHLDEKLLGVSVGTDSPASDRPVGVTFGQPLGIEPGMPAVRGERNDC